MSHGESPPLAHQPDRLARSLILRVLFLSTAVSLALAVIAFLLLYWRVGFERPSRQFPERRLPAPREISNVRQEMFGIARPEPGMLEQQRLRLERFGWVDRDQGLVHIPIEAAMELLLRERALPPQEGASP